MPIRYRIFSELHLLVTQPTDFVTEECIRDYFDRVWTDPDWKAGLNRLVDNRNITDIDMTYVQMRTISGNEKPLPPGQTRSRITVFIAPEDISYGMARMYKSINDPSGTQRIHIVDTLDQAMQILEISSSHRESLNKF